jgi:hypothetical protein
VRLVGSFAVAASLVLAVLAAQPAPARAQSGGGFDLLWSTLDGGGVMLSEGGGYRLGGTVGQPDAVVSAGGGFTLRGGFWQAWLGAVSGVAAGPGDPAPRFSLRAPAPNPFHASVVLFLVLPAAGALDVSVYDVAGRRVRMLVSETRPAGPHSVAWDGLGDHGVRLPSGVYFMEVRSGGQRGVKRVVLLD